MIECFGGKLMKKYDLLVIGNGFDLNLGYCTSYSDYCKDLIANYQPIQNKLTYFFYHALDYGYMDDSNWTSFEKVLCQYLEFLNYLFTSQNIDFDYEVVDRGLSNTFVPSLTINDINKMPTYCLKILDISNPLDKILEYYWFDSNDKKHYMDCRLSSLPRIGSKLCLRVAHFYPKIPSKNDVRDFLIATINKCLEGTEKNLSLYIKRSTSSPKNLSSFIKKKIGDEVDYLVTFNYSKTAEDLFQLTPIDIAYVHGNVDGEIVLGIEENMIENQAISEESPFFIFFKRARRFIKRCNESFSLKILNNINPETRIAIFGHSLDKSDKSIFQLLFTKDFKTCDIYYFGEEKNYRAKLISLVGLNTVNKLNNSGKLKFTKIT